jgi:hypothetical protein
MNKFEKYLTEDTVAKALNLPEPKVGSDYPSEKVKRYLKIIDNALEAMKSKEENDANDAIIEDLRDKRKKWKNVDKETEPKKTKLELPPDQMQQEQPPENKLPPKQEDIIIKHITMILSKI